MDYSDLLPTQIILGGTRYAIVLRNREWMETSNCAGQCRWPDMEVDIVSDQAASEVLNTLLHECLHLCYREWSIKPRCGEERTVTALGFALTALYVQNPDLLVSVQALTEVITHGE